MLYTPLISVERGIVFHSRSRRSGIFNQIGNVSFPSLFLQQQYLRSEEEGKEEVTLQLLLNVSTQCGVCFPCNTSVMTSSLPLVHTVRDDTLLEVVTSLSGF